MWTTAASLSDAYVSYEDILYRRSRKYIEAAEMKVRLAPPVVVPLVVLLLMIIGLWRNLCHRVPRSGLGSVSSL
jgi:hypothetical protein